MKYMCFGWMLGVCLMGIFQSHVSIVTYIIGLFVVSYAIAEDFAKGNS